MSHVRSTSNVVIRKPKAHVTKVHVMSLYYDMRRTNFQFLGQQFKMVKVFLPAHTCLAFFFSYRLDLRKLQNIVGLQFYFWILCHKICIILQFLPSMFHDSHNCKWFTIDGLNDDMNTNFLLQSIFS